MCMLKYKLHMNMNAHKYSTYYGYKQNTQQIIRQ